MILDFKNHFDIIKYKLNVNTMNKEELKNKIVEANKKYRSGNPIMSDIEYDNLLEDYQKMVSNDEYTSFRNTLNEGMIEYGKKIKHKYIAGSLNKIKYENPDDIRKFISKNVKNKLSVSAKIDGLSGIATYKNGKLVEFATRGNGTEGISVLDKAPYIKHLPQEIKIMDEIHIRGEMVICKSEYDKFEGDAYRNIVAGIINRKEWKKEDVQNISFIAYTIMGDTYCKVTQFEELEYNGFTTAWHENYDIEECNSEDFIEQLFDLANQYYDYQTDGLVLSDSEYFNENVKLPKNQVAFKTNQQTAETRLIDVEWQGPSKDGRHNILGILEPVEISGVTVSACTLHNIDFIKKSGVKIGDIIKLTRSGDVVPKFISVVSTSENSTEIQIPKTCNCCGSELVKEGPFIYCKNKNCIGQTTYQVMHFIKRLGIDFASYKTLNNFGIHTFDDLLNFRANLMSKNEMKLEDQLKSKMFNKSEIEIFCAINMKDIAEKTLRKIIEHYGWENIKNNSIDSDTFTNLPIGIGDLTMNKFISCYKDNLIILNKIISDTRYIGNNDFSEKESTNIEIKGSVCITGPVYHFKNREEFLKMAEDFGYESKSGVSKGLTYLINNDINSTSSKNKKAKSLGIPIISEEDFMKIVGYYKFTPDGL